MNADLFSDDSRAKFVRNRFVYLTQFISPEQAHRFEVQTRNLPARRVQTGIGGVTWNEQQVPSSNPIYRLFIDRGVLGILCAALEIEPETRARNVLCWIARYGEGEYIDAHRDGAGTIQLIVCLLASREENGGLLVLKSNDGEQRFFLRAGDAMLFEATTIEHRTTPLIRFKEYDNPTRVVAVARYYF